MTWSRASTIKATRFHAVFNQLPHLDLPILVVDDAKFSSAIIARILRNEGFSNVRFTSNPLEALRSIEKRTFDVIIADWLMTGMDGVEFARRVRKRDEETGHFTYLCLMMARDDVEPIRHAMEAGADDFLNKGSLGNQLLPRVLVASRIAQRHNDLLETNRRLSKNVADLEASDLVDPVTGLGNHKFTIQRLTAALTQCEARGGATCLMLVGINNLDVISSQYDASSIDELMSGLAARIRSLVRPLDVVTRPESDVFAVITLQETLKNCTSESFKRVFDQLYMQSFRTAQGYIPVVVGVSITATDQRTGHPSAGELLDFGRVELSASFESGMIRARPYDPTAIPDPDNRV